MRDLCDVHAARRKAILNRIKHRRRRARQAGRSIPPAATGGAVTLTGEQAANVAATLTALQHLQTQISDRLARSGQEPRGDTRALFRYLAELRASLRPVLAQSEEELVELRRPTHR